MGLSASRPRTKPSATPRPEVQLEQEPQYIFRLRDTSPMHQKAQSGSSSSVVWEKQKRPDHRRFDAVHCTCAVAGGLMRMCRRRRGSTHRKSEGLMWTCLSVAHTIGKRPLTPDDSMGSSIRPFEAEDNWTPVRFSDSPRNHRDLDLRLPWATPRPMRHTPHSHERGVSIKPQRGRRTLKRWMEHFRRRRLAIAVVPKGNRVQNDSGERLRLIRAGGIGRSYRVLTCRRIHLSPACSRMPKLKKDVSETSHMRDKPSEPQFHKEVGVKEI
ncbi:hypothetical protein KCU93_g57, partial [Aureobasidium melanogenum]